MFLLLGRGPGPEWVCLGPAGSVRVFDFVQERLHPMSPGDTEGTFIKAGDSEIRKAEQRKQQERPRLGCFVSLKMFQERIS